MPRKLRGEVTEEQDIEVGIDLGIIEVKITSAYGGGLKVEFGGQEIVWGREGGSIHYKVGIFEVEVEAIDCVVTETKKIAGQVVMTRTYPDPGCKKEEEKEKEEEEEEDPTTPGLEAAIPDDLEEYWAILGEKLWYKIDEISAPESLPDQLPIVSNLITPTEPNPIPFSVEKTLYDHYYPDYFKYRFQQGQYVAYSYTRLWGNEYLNPDEVISITAIHSTEIYEHFNNYGWRPYSYSAIPLAFFGTGKELRKVFSALKEKGLENLATYNFGLTGYHFPFMVIPLKPSTLKPPSPPGNKPPMNRDCCEEINDKLDDLLEVLDVEHFQKKKFKLPAYLVAPGVSTSQELTIDSYYELFQELFRAVAHTSIISPKTALSKDGQVTLQNMNATAWAESLSKLIVELLLELKKNTAFDTRTAITTTQTLITAAATYQQAETLLDCLGIPTKRTKAEIETAYNLVIESRAKGFAKTEEQAITTVEGLTEEELMTILLKNRNNLFVHDDKKPDTKTIRQMIEDLMNK